MKHVSDGGNQLYLALARDEEPGAGMPSEQS